MIDKKKSIELLNKAVNGELMAINQYMYIHFLLDDRGYDPLAGYFKKVAIQEMIHAERLAERILFLKGDVEMMVPGPVKRSKDVKELLKIAEKMETDTVNSYNEWAKVCSDNQDMVSKQLFDDLLKQEEEHQDNFGVEIDNMTDFGENYLALQSIERSVKHGKGESL